MGNYDDFDDFDFKPVTKGLGFHHNEKKEPKKYTKKIDRTKTLSSSSDLEKEAQRYDQQVNKTDLSAFYASPEKTEDKTEEKLAQVDSVASGSDLYFRRVAAWLVDVVIVSFLSLLTFVASTLISGIHYSSILEFVTIVELSVFIAIVFATYYVIYFSILDMYKTPGKNLFKLKMNSENKKITFKASVLRSVISLFLVPMILNLHGLLTKTSVIDSRR